jgi:hypothetical protein
MGPRRLEQSPSAISVHRRLLLADQPNERIKLLTTPRFSSYEDSLRSDMNRILASRNFDFDRDVVSMYLYRWGHSMVYPKPGWPFSAPMIQGGQVTRVPSPRYYARQQVGHISIGAQDVESIPAKKAPSAQACALAAKSSPFYKCHPQRRLKPST